MNYLVSSAFTPHIRVYKRILTTSRLLSIQRNGTVYQQLCVNNDLNFKFLSLWSLAQ
jgi:hypothetical protein